MQSPKGNGNGNGNANANADANAKAKAKQMQKCECKSCSYILRAGRASLPLALTGRESSLQGLCTGTLHR